MQRKYSGLPVSMYPLHSNLTGDGKELVEAKPGNGGVKNSPISQETLTRLHERCKALREASKLENQTTKELVLRELLHCLILQAHLEEKTLDRTITAAEAAVKNANTKNIIKLLGILGVDAKKEDDGNDDPFGLAAVPDTDTVADTDSDDDDDDDAS